MNIEQIYEDIHPKSGELYKVGDVVCIYQGRFGHNNIMTIKSMWLINAGHPTEQATYVSNTNSLPGTSLSAVKFKVSTSLLKRIKTAQLFSDYKFL